MTPKHQNRRLGLIALFGSVLAIGSWMLFSALQQSTQFFYNPSEITTPGFVPKSDEIRMGGMVAKGSFQQGAGIESQFVVQDFPEDGADTSHTGVPVTYFGVLPDLFDEEEGVVVTGNLMDDGTLVASEVLAKHDENYQPKK